MVEPLGALGTFAAGAHVERVVRRQLLLLAAGQHRQDAQADGLHRQRRRPVVGENAQANVPVAVDVRVDRNAVANEHHFRRLERIVVAKGKNRNQSIDRSWAVMVEVVT